MTLDQAVAAGQLAKALDACDENIEWVQERHDDEEVGLGSGAEYSDSGSTGCGSDIILSKALTLGLLKDIRERILRELSALGVDAP